MNIIGLNGLKRSGKDTTASIIKRKYNGGVVKTIGFADALKIVGMKALGFDRSDEALIWLADSLKIDGVIRIEYLEPGTGDLVIHEQDGRGYQQHLGTDARDVLSETLWIDKVLPPPAYFQEVPSDLRDEAEDKRNEGNLRSRYPGVDLLVITDVRFENEAERIVALGGSVWEITRPGTESDGHASEQRLPEELISIGIANDGTIEELDDKVLLALEGVEFAASQEKAAA